MQVAELLVRRGQPKVVLIVGLVLKMLCWRIGTLLLCGFLCLDWKRWPFVLNFSEISLDRREIIIAKWSRERFLTPLRAVFVAVKLYCMFVFFTRVRASLNVFLPFSLSILRSSIYSGFRLMGRYKH